MNEVEGFPTDPELFNPILIHLKSTFISLFSIALVLACTTARAGEAPATPAAIVDVPCKITEKAPPQFPARLIREGVTHGSVQMLLHISSTGELTDRLVTAYTREPFADAALQAVDKWKFVPGKVKGEPVDTIITLTFQFDVKQVLLLQKFASDLSGPDHFDGFEYHASNVLNLDRVPRPLNVVEPTYPQEWMKQGIVGSVAVDFFIDETGKTRFPTAAAGANELLASIAVAAVQQWRFMPPTAKNKPVLVRARQVFNFQKENPSS